MKITLAILTLLGFAGVGVFGFLMMGDLSNHASCLASNTQGAPCPEENPLAFASFHLFALKFFGTATFTNVLAAFFVLIAVLAVFGIVQLFVVHKSLSFARTVASIRSYLASFVSYIELELRLWLAARENSPAFLFRATV